MLLLKDTIFVSLAFTANFFFFFLGISKTTANAAAIIYVGTPIIAALIGHYLIGERTTIQKWIGIGIGLIGSILVLVLPVFETGQNISGDVGGNILIGCATLCWALYTVGSRHLSIQKHYSPIVITSVSTFVCAAIFFVVVLFSPHQTPIYSLAIRWDNVLWFSYLAFFVTIVTNYLFQWAIKHSSTMTATLTHYLQPIFSFIFNNILLGEILSPGMIAGSVIIMFGVFLATGARTSRIIRNYLANSS